jgi:hypothetical protein
MYAVIYDNRVLVGPMNWNRGMFQGALEKKGIKQVLPRNPPDDLPMTIDEHAKIMQVEEIKPEINTLVEYYYGPLWDIQEIKAIANYEVHDTNIESARYNLKQLAAQERYNKEIKGTTVTIQETEVTVDTNRGARDIFVQKYLLMNDIDTVHWKFPETWLTLTKQDLGLVVQTGAAYTQSCFDWELSIAEQIDLAETKQELLDIVIIEPQENEMLLGNRLNGN